MTRWAAVAGDSSGDAYQRRFDALAVQGASVHGEADFVSWVARGPAARVLDAGCGTGRVAIELHRRGHEVVGVDSDPSMLAVARRTVAGLPWLERDLAELDPADPELGGPFDLVVLAGNVIPLLAPGTERAVIERLVAALRPAGRVVAGFGLDVAHLPLDEVPLTLADYDVWCAEHGLQVEHRFSTWERAAYVETAGYAVSVHRSGRRSADVTVDRPTP